MTVAAAALAGGQSARVLLAREQPQAGARSERRLIRAAQQGSTEALEALFRRHWRPARRAAFLVVHDSAAAEDIAQEAFLSAIRALDRFDRRRPFGPWLHRIVVNRAIDWARSRELRREVSGTEFGDLAEPDAPEPFSPEVVEAMASLAPEQRAVLVLRYGLDYSPGEIAGMLGLPPGTVGSRLDRGRKALAELLGEGR